jgi:hypothetical protein
MPHVSRSLATVALLAAACSSPPVEAPKTTVEQSVPWAHNIRDQVDLLFMIDDSGSMSPKQEALKTRFPALINVLNDFAAQGHKASYHIGVVTSDLGAPGIHCGSNLGGRLQQRGLATTNAPGCLGPVGKNYIEFDQRDGTDNFSSTGQDLATTFSCMATVVDPDPATGHTGCGFESQLEAVYKALHDPIPENAGFLRPDAIVAIVWVTDEDDCSVDDPHSDLFTNSAYGPLNSYLCARYGIVCDGMLLPAMPQASFGSCAPAHSSEGGKLAEVDKYVRFFTLPMDQGGIKRDPNDVILAAITAPATPVSTVSASGPANCGTTGSCTNIAHSCVAAADASFFGDPSQRLSYVVDKAKHNQITSICDGDYQPALKGIGEQIVNALSNCLTSPVADAVHPDCVVEDVYYDTTGAHPKSMPQCDASASVLPCWRMCNAADPMNRAGCSPQELAALSSCKRVCNPKDHQFQIVGVNIERGGVPPEPGTTLQITCDTQAIANEDPDAACQP